MDDLLKKFLIEIIIVVLPVVSTFFVRYLSIKTKQLKDIVINKELNSYIDLAEELIEKTVIEMNQTFVDALKVTDNFDEIAQKKAFDDVKNSIMKNLTEQSRKAIELLYKDVSSYVDREIQVYVNKNKK